MKLNKALKLRKSKYISKKRDKRGNWEYKYKESISKKVSNLNKKISQLIIEERKQGKQYPSAIAYKNYYTSLLNAKSKKEIMDVTSELDNYLKKGDKYSIKNNKVADSIRIELYKILMYKRKEVVGSYNVTGLKDYINKVKKRYEKVFKKEWNQIIEENADFKDIFYYLDDIISIIEHPENIGLYEESQFNTIQAEVNHNISLISKKSKIFSIYPFDEQEHLNILKAKVKESLRYKE